MWLLCNREEWAWLQSHVYSTTNGSGQPLEDESSMESGGLADFIRSLRAAVTHLLTKLNIPLYRVTRRCSLTSLRKRSQWASAANRALFFSPSPGVPVRRVHPRAAAVWGQGVHVAAAASQRGLQLKLLAPGGHQGAGPHHAAADLRAGWVQNFGVFPSNEDQHFSKRYVGWH